MIGRTLGVYFAKRFAKFILGIFVVAFFIAFLFDFLELFRSTSDRIDATVFSLLAISLMRVPSICEQILPFAVLFGAIGAFLSLSRALELVVVRAAGVSVWQFLLPGLFVALVIGVVATTVYNPVAAILKDRSDELNLAVAARGTGRSDPQKTAWFRQSSAEGEAVIRAGARSRRGEHLANVTILQYDRTGAFTTRIEAESATYRPGFWDLKNGRVEGVDGKIQPFSTHAVPTYLTTDQVRDNLASPDSVPFWSLPRLIDSAQNAGIPAFRYQLQYHVLLSRPLLLIAMVVVAALVSLRVFRFGNINRMILSGVATGFVLYVVSEIFRDVGGAGLVAPSVAAWAPGVIASLMGFTVLLYQEDD